ncbi:replication-relaxation family protein [Actinacidiphila guanduensis]|uniref:replication-relaxation family protein n=1 Tax=Actinacidiphila guanduensis TaxID=310781 RepID=UPI0038990D50
MLFSSGSARGAAGRGRQAARAARVVRAGAEVRGEVLVTPARFRLATPEQLRVLLVPHQEGTQPRAPGPARPVERPPLAGRVRRALQSYWFCVTAGLAEAAASGLLPAFNGAAGAAGARATGRKAAARTGLREHGPALVDAAVTFHAAGAAAAGDWQLEPAHPTLAGPLIPDAVVLLATGRFAFVEVDRGTMAYACLRAKLGRYAAYRTAPHRASVRARQRRQGAAPALAVALHRPRVSSRRSRRCWWCSPPRRRSGRRSSWPAPPAPRRSVPGA